MSEYYKHDNSFDADSIQILMQDLTNNIKKIFYGKVITVSFSCKIDEDNITWYGILIELHDNYLHVEDFNELNKFMENSHYRFNTIFLSLKKYITLKYVR